MKRNGLLVDHESDKAKLFVRRDKIGGIGNGPTPLTRDQLAAKLVEMERNMREGKVPGTEADQGLLYDRIVHQLEYGPHLRLMVQASAGTGKSYLLVAVCIWCILHRRKFKAAAPTGIAASNIEVPGTDVAATTIHTLFEFDGDFKTKRNLADLNDEIVQALLSMDVLCLDEVSMIDDEFWAGIEKTLSTLHATRHPTKGADKKKTDHIGKVFT